MPALEQRSCATLFLAKLAAAAVALAAWLCDANEMILASMVPPVRAEARSGAACVADTEFGLVCSCGELTWLLVILLLGNAVSAVLRAASDFVLTHLASGQ